MGERLDGRRVGLRDIRQICGRLEMGLRSSGASFARGRRAEKFADGGGIGDIVLTREKAEAAASSRW